MNRTLARLAFIALATCVPLTARAQDTAFVRVLRDHASAFTIQGGRMKGAGADSLARIAAETQFMMVGEDHGIREVPEFVNALWNAARPAGYGHIAVEIGPISGTRLESLLRPVSAQSDLDRFFATYTPYSFPFFFWKEEAQMLESVVKSMPGKRGVVWGIDQEFIMSPSYLLERLAEIAPNKTARDLAAGFAQSSNKGDKAMLTSGNPGAVWMVTTTDADIAKMRAVFKSAPGGEAATIIDELALSRDIYNKFNKGLNYESNQQRANLMKKNLSRFFKSAQAGGERSPKAIIKLGANHVFRGPSITNSYEIGSFVPEFAALNGGQSYGILLIVAKGTWNAFRPFGSKEEDKTQKYDALTTDEYKVFDLKSVLESSARDAWTFIDLRPVRAQANGGKFRRLDPTARRLLNSFDGVVVVPEGHASVYFR